MTYHSALDPMILTSWNQLLTAKEQNGPMKTGGLFEALHIAADLAARELIDNRIKGLKPENEDLEFLRLAVNVGRAELTYPSTLLSEKETWGVACAHAVDSIFWRPFREGLDPQIASAIDQLIEPAVARALEGGAEHRAIAVYVQTELVSNHKRMTLLQARKAAQEMGVLPADPDPLVS